MSVLRQVRVGFKPPNKLTPFAGKGVRVKGALLLYPKGNGKKPFVKSVIQAEANKMLTTLKPINAIIFTELMNEIKGNSQLAIEDLAERVARNLKQKDPQNHYPYTTTLTLYRAAIKSGAIKIN